MRCTQVYSHTWPQPVGQSMLEASHSCMWVMCPPWQHPWHQTDTPFTGWWLKADTHIHYILMTSVNGWWLKICTCACTHRRTHTQRRTHTHTHAHTHTTCNWHTLHWMVAVSRHTHTLYTNDFSEWMVAENMYMCTHTHIHTHTIYIYIYIQLTPSSLDELRL